MSRTVRIATRAELGSRDFRTPPRRVGLDVRKWFVVHYPGAGTPPRKLADYRRWIESIHMDERKWRGVGYNYFVDADGNIGEGCGRDVVGAHSPPHNVDGIGVNVWTSGGKPTDAGLAACRDLYEYLCQQKGSPLKLGWHGMDYPTACAGDPLIDWVRDGMPYPPAFLPKPDKPKPLPKDDDMQPGDIIAKDKDGRDVSLAQAAARAQSSYERILNVERLLSDLIREVRATTNSKTGPVSDAVADARGVSAYEQVADLWERLQQLEEKVGN